MYNFPCMEKTIMLNYLQSRKPILIKEDYEGRPNLLSSYLHDRPVTILKEEEDDVKEDYRSKNKYLIIPPLNTDIRFSEILPTHVPSAHEMAGMTMFTNVMERYDPSNHVHPANKHPRSLHEHSDLLEEFSWAIPTPVDPPLILIKKSLIHKVPSQHACGSCWAVSIASTMSDCLVVSGATGWSPNISATYIMACVPRGHDKCGGGNPAAITPYLERDGVLDTSCIDYSWCSGDKDLCTSVSSSRHFDAKTLTAKLNRNVPNCGCYYGNVQKYLYKLDPGSDVLYISNRLSVDSFRNVVKSHILDFGPVIGGYAVLQNFTTGNFTNPRLNGGVYFDRADYNGMIGNRLQFNDRMTTQVAGLHAVSIVGWGVAKNIQYDNDKYGDVPFWHCRNSWGKNWGFEEGYFKIAMYPFNKIAQFDKQVMTQVGGPVGSMILVRATTKPIVMTSSEISEFFKKNINRVRKDIYYKADPEQVSDINSEDILDLDVTEEDVDEDESGTTSSTSKRTTMIVLVVALILILLVIFLIYKKYG